jgi:hypothetical protein
MSLFKKILIFIIVIIFTYVLWRLIYNRHEILKKHIGNKEGFTFFATPDSELTSVKNSDPVIIQNINPSYASLPLRDFVIKASFNSAITGKYVNLAMIQYILSRGCRFLDFEIFLIDGAPVVAYSTDKKSDTIDTNNYILLDSVLASAVSNAFSQVSPNSNDPLFIHLRIKSSDPKIYSAVAKSIDFSMKAKLYNKNVTNNTELSEIMGKVVIVMDKTIQRDYNHLSKCSPGDSGCYNLTDFINMESGSETLFLQRYSEILNQCSAPPHILDKCKNGSNLCTNVSKMRLILPDVNFNKTQNPDYSDFISNYGCQIYLIDSIH